jgi:hypothetical protein
VVNEGVASLMEYGCVEAVAPALSSALLMHRSAHTTFILCLSTSRSHRCLAPRSLHAWLGSRCLHARRNCVLCCLATSIRLCHATNPVQDARLALCSSIWPLLTPSLKSGVLCTPAGR